MLKMIVEDDNDTFKATVVESENKDDGKYHPFVISGCVAVAEKVNRNKRRYPFEMLKKEFDRFIEESINKVSDKSWFFEHPSPDEPLDDASRRDKAAIKFEEISCDPEKKLWTGRAVLCCSDPDHDVHGFPRADLARSYYEFGGTPSLMGFSTRGYGELEDEHDPDFLSKGCTKVLKVYHLDGIDLVMSPSSGVWADGILESKNFMIDMHGQIVECAYEDLEKRLAESTTTFDLGKKREIITSALDEFLAKI